MFSIRQFLPRVKKYFRENLGAPFIMVFQALLLVCAGLLIVGSAELANGIAIGAYFSLVIGVVLQLISFMMHGEEAEECDYGKDD